MNASLFSTLRRTVGTMALLGLASVSAHADTVNFVTTLTAGGPTFTRPVAGTPPTSTSSTVYYVLQPFFVGSAGSYTLRTTAAALVNNLSATDTHLELYANAFNPATPLVNALASDDDSGGNSLSLITINLSPNIQYFTIPTTFSSLATGTITTQISGPGTVSLGRIGTAVPEPTQTAALGLGVMGLAGLMLTAKKRKASASAA